MQGDVLGERELEHEPAALAVLRNVTQPGVEDVSRRRVVELAAPDADDAALGPAQAGERLDQLGLAVPVYAGDADDLAGANLEGHAAHLLDAAIVRDPEILDLEQDVPRLRRLLLDAQQDVAADHGPGERLLGGALARNGLDRLAAAEHGDAVGDLEHLAELVRDEDDRDALAPQRAQDLEQVQGLLRRQDGGRLVEDQDVGVPVERLHDLDALLLADADVLDERARLHGEVERLRHVGDLLLRRTTRRAGRRP